MTADQPPITVSFSSTAAKPGDTTLIPNSVLFNTSLSHGAVRAYFILLSYSRGRSQFEIKQGDLARDIGLASSPTRVLMAELREHGLISSSPMQHGLDIKLNVLTRRSETRAATITRVPKNEQANGARVPETRQGRVPGNGHSSAPRPRVGNQSSKAVRVPVATGQPPVSLIATGLASNPGSVLGEGGVGETPFDPSNPPAAIAGIHRALRRHKGYSPTQAFFDLLLQRYAPALDLDQIGIAMDSWLSARPSRLGSVAFAMNWLKRELEEHHARNTTGATDATTGRLAQRDDPQQAGDAGRPEGRAPAPSRLATRYGGPPAFAGGITGPTRS